MDQITSAFNWVYLNLAPVGVIAMIYLYAGILVSARLERNKSATSSKGILITISYCLLFAATMSVLFNFSHISHIHPLTVFVVFSTVSLAATFNKYRNFKRKRGETDGN